jgi:hypothetical protein
MSSAAMQEMFALIDHVCVGIDSPPLPVPVQPPLPVQEPVAAKDWEGAEYWMPLAWELCADECGEDACNELIWEGGAVPEPWGDRWLKYEDEAKRLIALVQKHTTPSEELALQWKEGCHALELALETERDAANLYAKQVAHWIGKYNGLQQDAKRYRHLYDLVCQVGVDSELVRRLTYNKAHLDTLIEDSETARGGKENT